MKDQLPKRSNRWLLAGALLTHIFLAATPAVASESRVQTLDFDSHRAASGDLDLGPLVVRSLCPGHFHLGDVGGDNRRDLILHGRCPEGYAFQTTGRPFTLFGLTVAAEWRGMHVLATSGGGRLELDGTLAGRMIEFPDSPEWREITEVRWSTTGTGAIDSILLAIEKPDEEITGEPPSSGSPPTAARGERVQDRQPAPVLPQRSTTYRFASCDEVRREDQVQAMEPGSCQDSYRIRNVTLAGVEIVDVRDDRPPALSARLVADRSSGASREPMTTRRRFEVVCEMADDCDPSPVATVSVTTRRLCRGTADETGVEITADTFYCGEVVTLDLLDETGELRDPPACGEHSEFPAELPVASTRVTVTAIDRCGNRSTVKLDLPSLADTDEALADDGLLFHPLLAYPVSRP